MVIIDCRFTLKRECDLVIIYIHMHRTDKKSQYRSIIWSVWLNGWVFIYELSDCKFESRSCNFYLCYSNYECTSPEFPLNKVNAIVSSNEFVRWYLFHFLQPTFIIFWVFLMFYQIFLSSQVKRGAIIINKHGIYELPHELPNKLRFRNKILVY